MSEFKNDLQRLTFLKRTIALLSSMVDGGECHTSRSNEMKNNAQQVILDMEANDVRTSEATAILPLVSGSAFIAKADRENILVLVDDKYKVFNKLREIGKTWKSITIEQIDKVV